MGTPARNTVVVPAVVSAWPCLPASVPAVRHDVRGVLADWGVPAERVDAVELVVSELMANAVRHAGLRTREVLVAVERDGHGGVRLEVTDAHGEAGPELRNADADAESGRGLSLVDAVTGGRWGFSRDPRTGGKRVWARIPESDGPAIARETTRLGSGREER
jgi:anti-sigma regulatory factor (Ser/Thr protein kinase)